MRVFLSPLAEQKLEHLLLYLERKWSRKVRDEFLEKLNGKFQQIQSQPRSCKESDVFSNLFVCVVTSQTSFFYRIKNQEIEIITVIDNRQNPEQIEKELNLWRSK